MMQKTIGVVWIALNSLRIAMKSTRTFKIGLCNGLASSRLLVCRIQSWSVRKYISPILGCDITVKNYFYRAKTRVISSQKFWIYEPFFSMNIKFQTIWTFLEHYLGSKECSRNIWNVGEMLGLYEKGFVNSIFVSSVCLYSYSTLGIP